MTTKHTIIAALAGLLLLGVSQEAAAERRTNDLAKDVAVRHRRLLVKNRLEFTPLFESTVNADFKHIVGGGAKLEYHLTDMISIGALGVGSASLNTGLVDKVLKTFDTQADKARKELGMDGMAGTDDDIFIREPSQEEFRQRLNTMPLHGAAYASLTPWYGKLAAFSQAFVAFDFYFQGGLAFAQLKSNCSSMICNDQNPGMATGDTPADGDPNNDPPLNDGQRLGLYLGGGIHVFLNDFIALDLTIRDYAFTDNPSGADFDAKDQAVTKNDSRFVHHLFFGAGLSIMIPFKVKRTP
jgi:outer membrane beta-barrel protein